MAQSQVLIIGDDAQVLQDINAGLAEEGYRTESVGNLEQAIGVLGENIFPVVLIDLSGFALDGLSLCSWIRRFNKESLMVALCGQSCNPSECQASGFNEVLHKPYGTEEVIQLVKRALEQCGM